MNDHLTDTHNDEMFRRAFLFNLAAGTATPFDIAVARDRGWISATRTSECKQASDSTRHPSGRGHGLLRSALTVALRGGILIRPRFATN